MSKSGEPPGHSEQRGNSTQEKTLHASAEAIVRETGQEQFPAMSADSMREVLHELRMRQVGLEMQNDELRRAVATREHYRELYDMAPVGYCTLSEKGLIVEANLTTGTLLGMARGALIAQSIYRFIVRDDQVIYYFHRKRLREVSEAQACELRMVKQGGATFWARMEVTSAHDKEGGRIFRVMISDISERKQTEARLQLPACVFSHAREAIVITAADGTIAEVNSSFTRITGYRRDESLGRNSRMLVSDRHDRAFHATVRRALRAEGYWSGEVWNRRKDGTVYLTMQTISTVPDTQGNIRQIVTLFSDITAIKQAEDALRESEERFNLFMDVLPAATFIKAEDGTVLYMNRYLEDLVGGREWLGKSTRELFPPEMAERMIRDDRRALAAGASVVEEKVSDLEGTPRIYQTHKFRIPRPGKAPVLGGIALDITERKQVENVLRDQEEFFRLITENLEGFVAVLDVDGRRVYTSPSYARLLGDRNLSGTSSFEDVHQDDYERVVRTFRETVATGIGQHLEYRLLMADGGIRLMESRGGVIKDGAGQTKRVVVVSHDVTERKEAEERIRNLAFQDVLTQLPNRLTLNDRLQQVMATSERNACHGALMFIDLDNFKSLNDTHGHEVGDLLLIEVATRLKSCVRAMDTVARFGGDEFVVMLSSLHKDKTESTAETRSVAEKIRFTLAEPYLLTFRDEGVTDITIEHRCTASIGVALFIAHHARQDEIFKWADTAMYQAKAAGRNMVQVYGDEQSSD